MDDVVDDIFEATGLTEADIDDVPSFDASTLKPPPVVTCMTVLHWPSVFIGKIFFNQTLTNRKLESSDDSYVNGSDIVNVAASSALDALVRGEEVHNETNPKEGGWEFIPDEGMAVEEDMEAEAVPGISKTQLWICNSLFAAEHVATGSLIQQCR